MKININQVLTQLNGQPIKDTDESGKAVDATVRNALVNAVLLPEQNEKGTQKVLKYELAKKIYQAKEDVEVTAEEVVMLKRVVGEAFAPLIVGQLMELFN